jgi:iron complex outermembrane receptor protein
MSGRADYSQQLDQWQLEAGWKSSRITTDNLSAYQNRMGIDWRDDLMRSNHFLYDENIHALYTSAQTSKDKWHLQGGLRYEWTAYDARQLGNTLVKDSSFSRNYSNLFPTLSLSYKKDSSHLFSFSGGRRIDRPAFQKLNPFLLIINKYTYQQGNPYFRPQYTWDVTAGHQYKDLLNTELGYSITSDYFSQLFFADTSGKLIYTEGNLRRLQMLSLSSTLQLSPFPWWTVSTQAVLSYKKMEGQIWKEFSTDITQLTISMNNQFRYKNGWTGELTANYLSRGQEDIQEILEPSGQVSLGLGKTILENRATIRLAFRDVFYTQWMKGISYFQGSEETFSLTRDSRQAVLSFSWRFGKGVRSSRTARRRFFGRNKESGKERLRKLQICDCRFQIERQTAKTANADQTDD